MFKPPPRSPPAVIAHYAQRNQPTSEQLGVVVVCVVVLEVATVVVVLVVDVSSISSISSGMS